MTALDEQVRADPAGELATRIQQTSGMVVAKGTEDTTFYRFTRFAALNEVGGSPEVWGMDVDEFHRLAADRDTGRPSTMTALTTHDTKRSEDTRARMAVLSEVSHEFAEAVASWTERCGIDEPALNLLAWQTIVGTWPISDLTARRPQSAQGRARGQAVYDLDRARRGVRDVRRGVALTRTR